MPTNTPTLAGLYVFSSEEKLTFPLKHTEVKAKIAGNLSRVEVTQKFENPFTEPLEATYVFPLPDEAAVDEMEIKIGDRLIKGNIKKREEAKQIYQKAKQEGRTAGLLEQERDNIFTQSLANIKPGEQIDVIIRYTDSLKFEGGDYEFVFPMVVGPRYIPGTPIDGSGDTDQVPDASKITPPIVPPATRSGHDIGVTVEIDGGMPIFQVHSTSHQIQKSEQGEIVTVKLANEDTIPNKDLILRYQVAGNNTKTTVLTQADERGGHFALYLIPALQYRQDEIVPKDVVFLMDTSGSQRGEPIRKCQELMRRFIHGLNPNDTFTIIDFANTATKLSETPLSNTPKNIATAINYINQLDANGGTQMLNGIREVLNFPSPSAGRLRSIVMLTDGYIGNEKAVLAEVQDKLQPGNRLYSFGVGSSVNRYLINRLAEIGRGIARVVRQDEPTQEVAEKFFQQINNPVLTQIEINWNGKGESPEIYPVAIPDLFAQQPLVLFGRKQDIVAGELQVNGIAGGGEIYQQTFPINFAKGGNVAVAQLWGRQKIKHLTNQMFDYDKKSMVDKVTETALSYQLLSEYTAFVAVSEEVRVKPGSKSISMEVPVEMAEGVSYEGIFGAAVAQNTSEFLAPSSAQLKSMRVESSASMMRLAAPEATNRMYSEKTRAFSGGSMMRRAAPQPTNRMEAKKTSKVKRLKHKSSFVNLTDTLLQIIQVKGLDVAGQENLQQHLQNVNIPPNINGEIVLELEVKDSRVLRVIVDDEVSTLKDKKVVEEIKRSLLKWLVPSGAAEKILITIKASS
ncbi:MAG: after-VIT domain-containing protein [Okeania sp. SIO2F4]|uniref:VIT domain-containing protein n=1 Tax=Okeania sp. SIO2F4 TaxID=2607790 RepID=UPI00142C9EF0|nr:VIT domain-containing protein [Okeania sp. SIO2F4]NES04001.1 after-VIT domain-containing protein [Okeania sp. SIO2F4]